MEREQSASDRVSRLVLAWTRRIADVVEPVLGERPTMEHVLLTTFLLVGIYMFLGASEFSPAAARFPRLMAGATAILAALLLLRNRLRYVFPPVLALLGAYLVYIGVTEFVWGFWPIAQVVVGAAFVVLAVGRRAQVTTVAEAMIAEPMQVLGEKDIDIPGAEDEPTVDAEATGEPTVDAEATNEPMVDAEATDEPMVDAEAADEQKTDTESAKSSGAIYVYEIDDPRGPAVTGILCVCYMILTFAIGMLYSTPLFVVAYTLWARMEHARVLALTAISFVTAYLFFWLISDDIAVGWYTGWEPLPPPTPPELLDQLLFASPQLVELGLLSAVLVELGLLSAVLVELGVLSIDWSVIVT